VAPVAGSPVPSSASPHAPSLFRFSIEARQAPALFVAGWLSTLVGAGLAIIGFLGLPGAGPAVLLLVGLGLVSAGLILLGGSQAIERRVAGEPYAGPSPILLFVAIIAGTLFVAAIVGSVLSLAGFRLPQSEYALGDLVSVALQALVFVGLVRLMVVGTGAISWREMGLTVDRSRILGWLAGGALLAAPVIIVTGVVASILVALIGSVPPSPLPPTGSSGGLALHLLAGAVLAPLSEEVVFRGAMLTAWSRSVGATSAIVRSSLLFALAHALTTSGSDFGQAAGIAIVATVARLPVAFALGWIYARTGTLWASIGLHATFNAVLIVVSEIGVAAPAAFLLLR